jgi:tRNA(fMet)-specific endonuclease VapC
MSQSELYMLDTDTCAFVLRRSSDVLLERIQAVPLRQQAMSVVTHAELLYGVQVSSKKKVNQAAVDLMIRHLAIHEWTMDAAHHYAEIRAELKKRGAMIGANALMIAAHARSLDATVVTNNAKDFRRIKGLKIENWMK